MIKDKRYMAKQAKTMDKGTEMRESINCNKQKDNI